MIRKRTLLGLAVFILTACGGGRQESLSLELGFRQANQLRAVHLGLVPEEWEGSADSIEVWVRRYGGRVLSRERRENRRITLELRVPVENAESLLTKIRASGRVFAEEVKRADIGQSVSDIESQIRLKEEAIARYRELFSKARTPGEILEIEKALSTTIQERDSLLNLLEKLRAESGTVLIVVQLVNRRYAEMGAGGSFWSQFGRAFVDGWDLFKDFLIVMAHLWWLWIGLVLFVWILIRLSRRSLSTQSAASGRPPQSPSSEQSS